jgi:hypothetical protein
MRNGLRTRGRLRNSAMRRDESRRGTHECVLHGTQAVYLQYIWDVYGVRRFHLRPYLT